MNEAAVACVGLLRHKGGEKRSVISKMKWRCHLGKATKRVGVREGKPNEGNGCLNFCFRILSQPNFKRDFKRYFKSTKGLLCVVQNLSLSYSNYVLHDFTFL
jgi:hypothetical protein